MENEKDYIDKLYSEKFSKFESQISSNDWAKLSTKLIKTNFLKFSFTNFNAYFLGVIVSFAAAATYLGVNNLSLSKKIEKLENKIEVLQEQQIKNDIEPLLLDTIEVDEPKVDMQPKVLDSETVETKPIKKTEDKTKVLPEQLKTDSINTKNDSLTETKPDTTFVKPKKIIRRIKKQVFVKQDKVLIKDTVTVTKKE